MPNEKQRRRSVERSKQSDAMLSVERKRAMLGWLETERSWVANNSCKSTDSVGKIQMRRKIRKNTFYKKDTKQKTGWVGKIQKFRYNIKDILIKMLDVVWANVAIVPLTFVFAFVFASVCVCLFPPLEKCGRLLFRLLSVGWVKVAIVNLISGSVPNPALISGSLFSGSTDHPGWRQR